MPTQAKEYLELSALVLSIINALILIQNYLRDRPSLEAEPIHPDVYQWWFPLPEGAYDGEPTRRYGFLVYVGIGNRGPKKVSLKSWRLFIRIHASRKEQELKPLSISEPVLKLGNFTKAFSVLGVKGLFFEGETIVDSGCSISGWAYYVAEYYGDRRWNPVIKNGTIQGNFIVQDIFGCKARTRIEFKTKDLTYIEEMIPNIGEIGRHESE